LGKAAEPIFPQWQHPHQVSEPSAEHGEADHDMTHEHSEPDHHMEHGDHDHATN
jgi:hypothetical protein